VLQLMQKSSVQLKYLPKKPTPNNIKEQTLIWRYITKFCDAPEKPSDLSCASARWRPPCWTFVYRRSYIHSRAPVPPTPGQGSYPLSNSCQINSPPITPLE